MDKANALLKAGGGKAADLLAADRAKIHAALKAALEKLATVKKSQDELAKALGGELTTQPPEARDSGVPGIAAPGVVPKSVSDAIAQVRAAHGLDCEKCALDLERALPGGRVRPIAGEGLTHEVYHYQGKVLDPTARQYVKPAKAGVCTEEELVRAGLKDAVDSGVFTPEQHGQFLKKLNERFPGVWRD